MYNIHANILPLHTPRVKRSKHLFSESGHGVYQTRMCPWDTGAPADAKFAYSHKQKQKRHFYEQREITLEAMR